MNHSVPDFQSIMLPVLNYLQDGRARQLNEVVDSIANHFELTDDDLRVRVPSGQQPLFKNRLTWAISYLKNAGLLVALQRGIYQITNLGKDVAARKLERVDIAYLKQFDAFQQWQSSFGEEEGSKPDTTEGRTEGTPEERVGLLIKGLQDKLILELLDLLKNLPPSSFEKFVLVLLTQMGYGGANEQNFEVTGKSGDNGIDGVIYQDEFGLERVYVQAKRWADNKVQSKDIRDFIGSLSLKGTNKGIFIATSRFTEDAYDTANLNPHNRIILINGVQLAEYAIRHKVGVQVKRSFEVKGLDGDFFEEL